MARAEPGFPGTSAPALLESSLRGLCPRCAAPSLFAGWVRFGERCERCGLDYERFNVGGFNVGDGPAAFLTLIIGSLIVMLAICLERVFGPPFWLHALLWLPLTIVLVLGGLRIAKAALLHSEYRQNAGEARAPENRK